MTHIVAETWLHRHSGLFTALGTLLAAALIVLVLDRFLVRRAGRLARAVTGYDGLSQDAATRLRFARRTVEAVIVVIAIAIALSQFDSLDKVGRTLLASSAITAAVVGFAARQTLANAVAGILLAVVQPIRIGDLITFEGETGTVEDVGLTYTWLRTGADARILIPNERLAGGILRNDSIRSPTVSTEVSVWLAPDADEAVALEALRALGVRARLAESTHEGLRLVVVGDPAAPGDRIAREGDLRAAALGALRASGVR
ncbi:mechanosensitive ion channel family protein [Baekduia soli]|uniref:mechanosensitive ion channel family protein n=1 Tax=Baekduia soli TaxID=496014 RepID=UPI001652180C|nr:mechanosensitive ion channel domain-containing protein [Baekduia soli]